MATKGILSNFSALSISSLDSDDRPDDISEAKSQIEIYRRLQELERVTLATASSFVQVQRLSSENDTFAEVARGQKVEFELDVVLEDPSCVLTISISSLPESFKEFDDEEVKINFNSNHKKTAVESLNIALHGKEISTATHSLRGLSFRPKFHANNEYTFVLSAAHGLKQGLYVLSLADNRSARSQYLRIRYRVSRSVRATPVEVEKPVRGRTGKEMVYYRFCNKAANKVVRIEICPILSHEKKASSSDAVELFISNRFDGLVGFSETEAVWKSTHYGTHRVDIHPDDNNAGQGDFYLIGVKCASSERADFSLKVTSFEPALHRKLLLNDASHAPLVPGGYSYFALPIDPTQAGCLVVTVEAKDKSRYNTDLQRTPTDEASWRKLAASVEKTSGRGVFTKDSLFSNAVMISPPATVTTSNTVAGSYSEQFPLEPISPITQRNSSLTMPSPESFKISPLQRNLFRFANYDDEYDLGKTETEDGVDSSDGEEDAVRSRTSDSRVHFLQKRRKANIANRTAASTASDSQKNLSSKGKGGIADFLAPSIALAGQVYPVVYASTTCIYPDDKHYSWKATGEDGCAVLCVEQDELKHCGRTLFLAVYGLDLAPVLESWGRNGWNITCPCPGATGGVLSCNRRDLEIVVTTKVLKEFDNSDSPSSRQLSRAAVFDRIFESIDGSSSSHADRSHLTTPDEASYTYGEVEYHSFQALLMNCGAKDGFVFYDLGCGAGKALIAAMFSDIRFLRCSGIELFPSLCECARRAIARAQQAILSSSADYRIPVPGQGSADHATRNNALLYPPMPVIEKDHERNHFVSTIEEFKAITTLQAGMAVVNVREGNLLDLDWSDADVVFAASICFSDNLLQGILLRGQQLRAGAILLTAKVPENCNEYFTLTKTLWLKMSWGKMKVCVLTRKEDNSTIGKEIGDTVIE